MDGLYALAGLGTGLLVGLTGVGGGSLMTPMLVLMFGVSPAAAIGTDLWFAAITKAVGGAAHQSRGSVDWQVLRRLSLGSVPSALATLTWMQLSGAAQTRQGLLMQALGVVLLLTAAAMLLRSRIQALSHQLRKTSSNAFLRLQPGLTVAAGALLGILVTLTSVGAGALGVVMLVYLYPMRLNPARLVGTDIVHAIPLTVVAGLGHLWMGHVELALLGQLLVGSIPGVLIGAYFSSRVADGYLRPAIAVVLIVAGVKLLLG